jgi:predicted thioredoxin/glutaredoxin
VKTPFRPCLVFLVFLNSFIRFKLYKAINDYIHSNPDVEIEGTFMRKIRSTLALQRQLLIYLDALRVIFYNEDILMLIKVNVQEQTDKVKDTLTNIGAKFEETLTDLKKTCKAKTAVPVDQVYVSIFVRKNNLSKKNLKITTISHFLFDWQNYGRIGPKNYITWLSVEESWFI